MAYKIVRRTEATFYNPPGHFDVRPTRLHNPGDVNRGEITLGLSHFLPGGGCDYGANAFECIYYVVEGEIDLDVDLDGEQETRTTLRKGDSFHCGDGTMKSIKNNGPTVCQLLVVLVGPKEKE